MSKALYRKYRSKSLSEIVGQRHVTSILQKALEQGKIAHAYLLTGPRGVGKTSIARILAHEINQLAYTDDSSHLDIIEIDAASNNGVEDIRSLRDKVQIAPVTALKKIYIIDEVHMLSKAAFNALLKTLEEPPEHIVFILATTDIEKLPATIVSRVQRFSFRSITPGDAVKHLAHIAKEEQIAIDEDALELIAIRGDGSFRDSISLLDQLSTLAGSSEKITRRHVEEVLGLASSEEVTKLLAAHEAKDLPTIIALLKASEEAGIQPGVLTSQLIQTIRSQLFEKPQLLPLLDLLLEVPRSSHPDVKLLTVLASGTSKPKHAALNAPTAPSISASIDNLRKQAPTPPAQRPKVTVDQHSKQQAVKPVEGEKEKTEELAHPNPTVSAIDWPKLVEYTREHFVAIYSVLSKCGYELINGTLTLYTGNVFYKKKLDDVKYRTKLTQSLIAIGVGNIAIETIATPKPPKDGVAASVAAIMGGGEEVSVGEAVAS